MQHIPPTSRCPDGSGGFNECLLDNDDGKKATVMVGHEKKVFKSEDLGQINPPKFEKCEDMANLTFLNDGSVFWNLKTRYQVSGLKKGRNCRKKSLM